MKFYKTILVIFFVFVARVSFAGNLTLEKSLPATNNLKVGDEVLLNVNFQSDSQVFNALEGKLSVGRGFEIVKAVTGNSIISVWLKNPANFEGGSVEFAGITPAGYNREAGLAFSMILRAKESGSTKISLTDAKLFLNDGKGTEQKVFDKSLSFNISSASEEYEPYKISVRDITAPEEFKIQILKDPNLFDGRWTLVFGTQDKGSGIRAYDVFEGNHVFKQVTSPYVLENQRLNGKIKVVAIDHEGNITTESLTPPGKVCLGTNCFGWVTIVVIVVLVFGSTILWRKFKK